MTALRRPDPLAHGTTLFAAILCFQAQDPLGRAPVNPPGGTPLAYVASTAGLADPALDGGDTELEFADTNGDGHLDLLSIGDHGSPFVNTNEHGIMTWFGDGQGAWSLVQTGNFGYGGIAVGDANNDGAADVAYGMHHDYSSTDLGDQLLEVALGDGTGLAWTPWDDGLATNGETWGMFATDFGDVDGDGWLDVLSNSFGCCAGAHVYRNDQDGSWTQTFGFLGGNADPIACFGDLDSDGHPDFAVGNSLGNLWRGDGVGGFSLVDGDLPGTAMGRTGFDLGDVDGDGRDEFAYRLAGGKLEVASWDGAASWQIISSGLPETSTMQLLQLAHMNEDRFLDVVATGGNQVGVWLGDGTGGFDLATLFPVNSAVTNGNAVALRAADFDHSGRADIVLIQDESCGLFCSRNKLYAFRETSLPVSASVRVTHPGPGTTWRAGSARTIEWQASVPAGVAASVTVKLSTSGPQGPWSVLAANVPADGRQQVLVPVTASSNCRVRVVLTAGNGTTGQSGAFRIVP